MGVPVVTITSNGVVLEPSVETLEVEIHRELNRIPEARLVFLDGSVATRDFEVSSSDLFVPGNLVSIAMRYEGDEADVTLFEGLVVRHSVEARSDGDSTLVVELKDKAFKLTRQRKSAVFRNNTDAAAFQRLIEEADLTTGEIATTTATHDELIQYYASDWDFIVSRADIQGLAVLAHLGTVAVKPLVIAAQPVRKLEYGLGDLVDFGFQIDGSQQWSELSSVGWDSPAQQGSEPTRAQQPSITAGNLDASAIASQLGGEQCSLLHPVPLDPVELQAWADARLLRSRLAMLRGRGIVDGDPDLAPLDTVELVGIGDRFNGLALVSAVTHRVDHEGWKTEVRIGLSPDWFSRKPDIAEVPAGGLLPAITGLLVGKVAGFESDPQGQHRIKVQLPALDAQQGFIWARLLRPDAGQNRGVAFWPEPDDEVVVGFLNGDPRQAVILGALFGSVNTPPSYVGAPSEANPRRAIVSRSGIAIKFDDELVQLCIETPAGNKTQVDDGAESISPTDQHGNRITMNAEGITIATAKGRISISAQGTVTIQGSTIDLQ